MTTVDQDDVQPDSPPAPVGRQVHLPWLDAFWLLNLIEEAEPRRRGSEGRLINERFRGIANDLRRQIKEFSDS